MKHRSLFIILLFTGILPLIFCSSTGKDEKEHILLLKTAYGNIRLKLYDETPKHRDNFIKLVKEHYYDSLLFHRVIKNFMIQGGDPDSRKAAPGQMLGNGGPGYTIPAEFNAKLYHKKGALAAAREGDNSNPSKESSGSQFYIVQGKIFTGEELTSMEARMNQSRTGDIVRKFLTKPENTAWRVKVDSLTKAKKSEEFNEVYNRILEKNKDEVVKLGKFKFSDISRKTYTTIGGAPHLDGNYTVFGEVLEGFDVIDKIAAVKTDKNDRPDKDIRMVIEFIE
jgi:cyclophilin family peptidyl-prolyl cis-trans isomerase